MLDKSDFDIFFLGQTLLFKDAATHAEQIKVFNNIKSKSQKSLIDAAKFYRFGAFGYMLSGKSVSKLKDIIEKYDFQKNSYAIDVLMGFWLKSGALKGGITIPYMIGVQSDMKSTQEDRTNILEHQMHCDLVNIYLEDYSENIETYWRGLLDGNPDPKALAICKAMYYRLTHP